jgi:hypothetical protein
LRPLRDPDRPEPAASRRLAPGACRMVLVGALISSQHPIKTARLPLRAASLARRTSSARSSHPGNSRASSSLQRGSGRPLTPPGKGGGSLAKRSTSSITSERCRDESLTKARSNRRPSIVSLDGDPSCSLRSDINVRFFISRLYRVDQVESMPRNNPHGKINRTAKRSMW